MTSIMSKGIHSKQCNASCPLSPLLASTDGCIKAKRIRFHLRLGHRLKQVESPLPFTPLCTGTNCRTERNHISSNVSLRHLPEQHQCTLPLSSLLTCTDGCRVTYHIWWPVLVLWNHHFQETTGVLPQFRPSTKGDSQRIVSLVQGFHGCCHLKGLPNQITLVPDETADGGKNTKEREFSAGLEPLYMAASRNEYTSNKYISCRKHQDEWLTNVNTCNKKNIHKKRRVSSWTIDAALVETSVVVLPWKHTWRNKKRVQK